ncbi:hypothetical protein MBLNU230_g0586t1 [Neophaeotheca triangularis]
MPPGPKLTHERFHSPSYTGPRSTPLLPSGGHFSILASTTVFAAPHTIQAAIVDIAHYAHWNSHTPKVTLLSTYPPQPADTRMKSGLHMTFHVNEKGFREDWLAREAGDVRGLAPSKEVCTGVSARRVCWAFDNAAAVCPPVFFKSERVCEIEALGETGCRVTTWQSWAGAGARRLKWSQEGELGRRFQEWCGDLKGWVEGGNVERIERERVERLEALMREARAELEVEEEAEAKEAQVVGA